MKRYESGPPGFLVESDDATIRSTRYDYPDARRRNTMKVVAAGFVVLDIRSSTLCSQDTRWHGRLPSTRAVSHGQSSEMISGHRKHFGRASAIREKRFGMLADLQRPALQENERLGSEYDMV